jgi:quinol monooxygenase YgiN
MFALHVRHELLAECVSAFDRLVEETMTGIRAHEPGTLVYLVGAPPDDPTVRIFLEVYRDEQAFEQHSSQPHVRRFLASREPMLREIRVDVVPDCTGKVPGPSPQISTSRLSPSRDTG